MSTKILTKIHNWLKDMNVEEAKREIDYQVEKCNVNTITFSFAAYQEHCYC